MNTVAIIQARMGSTRFPRKVMKPITGVPMIGLLIERLRRAQLLDQIILATSTDPSNDPLVEYIEEEGYPVFRGSEQDVLDRYFHAAKQVDADVVVRVTGDCPLIDPDVVDTVIRARELEQVDYASNVMPPTFPNGLDVEVFHFNVLEEAWREAKSSHEREHVTPYIRKSRKFTHHTVSHSEDLSAGRWVIDEPEDLQVVQMVFEHFYPRRDFGWLEVLALSKAWPERFMANQHHIRNQGSQLSRSQKLQKRAQRVVFRADAAHVLGHGHVMRCLTLAEALREQKAEVLFVCREHDGHLCNLISKNGFDVARLPAPNSSFEADDDLEHGGWLGASWQEDAEQTRLAMSGTASWVVADHYGIDWRWERALRTVVDRVLVIDDLANRDHECDLLLDQNLAENMNRRYEGRVPDACDLLLGPRYALLQPPYAKLHDITQPRKGAVERIFLFMGGGDKDNTVGLVLEAFLGLDRLDVEIDVVIPSRHGSFDLLRTRAKTHPNVHMHTSLPSLAPLMAKADLAIGAGGATNWERLCLGLPTLVWSRSTNQRAISKELHERGLVRWLGHAEEVTQADVSAALNELMQEGLDEHWSLQCSSVVDGQGASRVCSAMDVSRDLAIAVTNEPIS